MNSSCCCCCLLYNHCSSGHGLLKLFGPMVIGSVSRTARIFFYLKLCRPAYFVKTKNAGDPVSRE